MNIVRVIQLFFLITGLVQHGFVFASGRGGDFFSRTQPDPRADLRTQPDPRADLREPLPSTPPMPLGSAPTRTTVGRDFAPGTPKAQISRGVYAGRTPPTTSHALLSLAPEGTPPRLLRTQDPDVATAAAAAVGESPQPRARSIRLLDAPLVELWNPPFPEQTPLRAGSRAGLSSTTPSQRRSITKQTPPPLSIDDLTTADFDPTDLDFRATSTAPDRRMTVEEDLVLADLGADEDGPDDFVLSERRATASAAHASPGPRTSVISAQDIQLKLSVQAIANDSALTPQRKLEELIPLAKTVGQRFLRKFSTMLGRYNIDGTNMNWEHVFVMSMGEMPDGKGASYGAFADTGGHYFEAYQKLAYAGFIKIQVLSDRDNQPMQIKVHNLFYPNEIFQKTLFPKAWEPERIAQTVKNAVVDAKKEINSKNKEQFRDRNDFAYNGESGGIAIRVIFGDEKLTKIKSVYPLDPTKPSTPVLRPSSSGGVLTPARTGPATPVGVSFAQAASGSVTSAGTPIRGASTVTPAGRAFADNLSFSSAKSAGGTPAGKALGGGTSMTSGTPKVQLFGAKSKR